MRSILRLPLTFFVLLFAFQIGFGQNAMDFDGIDDRIAVSNGSAQIANSNLSMGLWVYPTNPAAGWPNFDGFAGFRNESNADFYLLQLSSTTVECRIRNSSGLVYTMPYSGLTLNTWHHFVLTHNGSHLKLYHNGVIADSIVANGSINNTSGTFYMGTLPFNTTNFDLDGRLDDVTLWSKALSPSEVNTLYNACSPDLSDPNLQLCYQFNQGTGGANNSGITQAIDSKGNINGQLQNFTLNGASSNFVTFGNPTVSSLVDTAVCSYTSPSGNHTWTSSGNYQDTLTNAAGCDSLINIQLTLTTDLVTTLTPSTCGAYTSPSGNQTWTMSGTYADTLTNSSGCDSLLSIQLTILESTADTLTDSTCFSYTSPSGNAIWTTSGMYMDTLINAAGCDSLLTIALTVTTPDTGVSVNSNVLTATAASGSFQWVNCDSGFTPIQGETNATYTATQTGNYAVIVSENGCVDTSGCAFVMVTMREELISGRDFTISPNPHTHQFTLTLPGNPEQGELRIFNALGQELLKIDLKNRNELLLEIPGPAGMYWVQLRDGSKTGTVRLIKK